MIAKNVLALAAMICVLSLLSAAHGQTTEPASPAATQPAELPDVCKGPVDPYDTPAEKLRFLTAAGVDNELTEKEFQADALRKDGFVRQFDAWKAMLAFDGDHNGTIDWTEADAYRQDLRKKVLAACDTNKDGKLAGDERQLAAKLLLTGALAAAKPTSRPAYFDAPTTITPDMVKKFDTDGDGKLSDEERKAALEQMRKDYEAKMLAKYDTNGDGVLDDAERKAIRREQQKPWQDAIDKIKLRNFDANDDGVIDEEEQKAVKAFETELQKVGKDWDVVMNDTDGDGVVSPEERQATQKAWQAIQWKATARFLRYLDADGDGTLSPEETSQFVQRASKSFATYADKFMAAADEDGDGRLLTDGERQGLIKNMRDDMAERVKKFDADGDGHLSPNEALELIDDFAKKDLNLAPVKSATQPAETVQEP